MVTAGSLLSKTKSECTLHTKSVTGPPSGLYGSSKLPCNFTKTSPVPLYSSATVAGTQPAERPIVGRFSPRRLSYKRTKRYPWGCLFISKKALTDAPFLRHLVDPCASMTSSTGRRTGRTGLLSCGSCGSWFLIWFVWFLWFLWFVWFLWFLWEN